MGELRVLLYLGAALLVVAGLKTCHDRIDAAGYARAKAEDRAAMEQQATSNRELQRAAEKRYTVTQEAQTRYITTTVTEVRHESQSLAACPVPDGARRLLNDGAACARGDSAASCGAGEPVPRAE